MDAVSWTLTAIMATCVIGMASERGRKPRRAGREGDTHREGGAMDVDASARASERARAELERGLDRIVLRARRREACLKTLLRDLAADLAEAEAAIRALGEIGGEDSEAEADRLAEAVGTLEMMGLVVLPGERGTEEGAWPAVAGAVGLGAIDEETA